MAAERELRRTPVSKVEQLLDFTRQYAPHEAEATAMLIRGGLTPEDPRFKQLKRIIALDRLKQAQDSEKDVTGVLSKSAFHKRFRIELDRARRAKKTIVLACLDLDDLRGINARFGHEGGDAKLQEVADILLQTSRTTDIVGRIGGDEFVVLLKRTTLENAQNIWWEGRTRPRFTERGIQISAGLAMIDPSSGIGSLNDADQALLRAKSGGKNTLELAKP